MRKLFAFALVPSLALGLCLPAGALTPGEARAIQENELDLEGLEREAAAR